MAYRIKLRQYTNTHGLRYMGKLCDVRFISVLTPALLAAYASAAPQGGAVVSGSAAIGLDPNDSTRTVINQTSQNTAINWNSFNIGVGETVSFVQPNIDAIALNRDFSGSPSQIYGNLDANGQVFLLNTAGVLIGAGASIDVGSLLVSDMQVSNEDATNFETLASSQGWSLPFSDQDIAAGGIEILGTIRTHEKNGIAVMGQYIYIEGDISSGQTVNDTGGDVRMLAGGSAVLITDPNGLYGVEISRPVTDLIAGHDLLFEIPESATSASIRAINGDVIIGAEYDASLPVNESANHLIKPGIAFNSATVSTLAGLGQTAGDVIVISNAVTITPPIADNTLNDIGNTLTDSLTPDPEETSNTLLGDTTIKSGGSLDSIMQSCQPKDRSDKDCIKQNAIKRYLGKLLIGGSLPD